MATAILQPNLKPISPPILSIRVYYEDTDAGGVVYHAQYLGYAERARTEWLRALLGRNGPLWTKDDPVFVVRHLDVDYQAPARLDDCLTVTTELLALGGASFELLQIITRDQTTLVTLKVTLVALSQDGKVLRIPAEWRQNLSRHLKEQE